MNGGMDAKYEEKNEGKERKRAKERMKYLTERKNGRKKDGMIERQT